MIKFKEMVLMLCLVLSGALCYASGAARTENGKGIGTPTIVIRKAHHGGVDKSCSISATLNDHVLFVAFTENLGQVTIEVNTATGATVDCLSVQTPNGYLYFITDTGDYIVTFTFPDGDVYYGEFTVTD
ncbi:MAG: DUF3244 domain-containing protein [Bacteroidales bacterium]|nr:DUF3244 domain-containing protein [Bacteroidales bacterium]MBR6931207.1 DUF3244 domain-containing protein [Bacteroidales bacterium]